jgi:hypothetical protein
MSCNISLLPAKLLVSLHVTCPLLFDLNSNCYVSTNFSKTAVHLLPSYTQTDGQTVKLIGAFFNIAFFTIILSWG